MSQPNSPRPAPGSVAEKLADARLMLADAGRQADVRATQRRIIQAMQEIIDAVEQLDKARQS